MQLLGHKDVHMTLLYLNVTQQDLQREFHCARQKAAFLHPVPKLPRPQTTTPERVVRHLLMSAHWPVNSCKDLVKNMTERKEALVESAKFAARVGIKEIVSEYGLTLNKLR
jgi:hypothetical protein